jgi:TRAP-type C4-dicarboxylate transport system permease large subunit
VNILRVAMAALPFFFLLLLGALIITVFPALVTYLPNAMGN